MRPQIRGKILRQIEWHGDSFDALKQCFNSKMDLIKALSGSKIENLQFELGEKLGHHYMVKFYGKSNGDSLDALKQCSNHTRPNWSPEIKKF